MQEYDSIRPFNDAEVPGVVARVVDNPEFGRAASKLVMPKLLQGTHLADWATRAYLRFKTRHLRTVSDCQLVIAEYFEQLVDETIAELTVSGLDGLDKTGCYLFMSNHRDIVMDSSLLNFLIHNAGHDTCRMAAGDNLMDNKLAADLMRLNKSFIVERSVSGARAALTAYMRTSGYIRHSVDEGVSIWIAQRQGRAKDGWDRTDPALVKMLTLAYKEHDDAIAGLLGNVPIVPVSISYELDPCALRKAHELYVLDQDGQYDKSEEEDLQSIITGMVGFKGRVHVAFSEPVSGHFDSPEELSQAIDRAIVSGLRVYPTHVEAAERLGDASVETASVPALDAVTAQFEHDLAACPTAERDYVLLQYANLIRNRQEFEVVNV